MPSDPSRPDQVPAHVAIVMDGNGRWAGRRAMPRAMGHRSGQRTAKRIVEACGLRGVRELTLFAFSSENWQRPESEVGLLMGLLLESLEQEVQALHAKGVVLSFLGDLAAFPAEMQARMAAATALTAGNQGLRLNIALGYGGRWDLVEAARRVAVAGTHIDEHAFRAALPSARLADVDLFIRTGGERRISNFLLWQLAYAELYFSDTLWPDFDVAELEAAFEWFASRQRRFGRVSEAS